MTTIFVTVVVLLKVVHKELIQLPCFLLLLRAYHPDKNLNPKAACLKRRDEEKVAALLTTANGDGLGSSASFTGEDFGDMSQSGDDMSLGAMAKSSSP